jgi:aerobic-type carbon monoxide dehydrogenase small subunit (CoxS/CutS family)
MRFTLRINGKSHTVEGEPGDSLLSVLRYELGLAGSKFGCGEGHCGACSVLVDNQLARSCTTRLAAVAGKPVTTIEAIGAGDRLHPVQQAFLDGNGFQCGYCTPGMELVAAALLEHNPSPSREEIVDALAGNVCRCTGYEPIVEAIRAAAAAGTAEAAR